jgi:glutaredoxin-like protein NrdH
MQQVTVYSTPFCVPCDRLKQYLRQHGVQFEAKDLMMDEESAERLESLGIRSSPVLEIDGQFFTGAQLAPEKIAQLLGLK